MYAGHFLWTCMQVSSVQISSVTQLCPTLWPHELQHARPPCPSPTPGVHSDSRPSSQWCHPAISSSVVPFSSCSQSLPASEYFPMSQLFAWGGQSTGVSALASLLPKKSQQKQYPVVNVTGDRSKVRCCKEQYCIGTWNVRSMNQGKLEVIKQEMERVNVDLDITRRSTRIRLIIFFAAKDGEALYSQQKQDWELTAAQIMNSLLPNSELIWRQWGKPLDHSGMT